MSLRVGSGGADDGTRIVMTSGNLPCSWASGTVVWVAMPAGCTAPLTLFQPQRGLPFAASHLHHCAPLTLGRFQQEGVRKGLEFGGRCLIADEMGLGKTVQVQLGVALSARLCSLLCELCSLLSRRASDAPTQLPLLQALPCWGSREDAAGCHV